MSPASTLALVMVFFPCQTSVYFSSVCCCSCCCCTCTFSGICSSTSSGCHCRQWPMSVVNADCQVHIATAGVSSWCIIFTIVLATAVWSEF